MDMATTGGMDYELPEGFSWAKMFVIKCERCKKTHDCRTPGEKFVTEHHEFMLSHSACLADPGLKLASSMTIRDELATRFMAAFIAAEGYGKYEYPDLPTQAVALANELLSTLYPPQARPSQKKPS